jgi:hypothetical protein
MIFRALKGFVFLITFLSLSSCGFYSLSGVTIPADIKTFQVDFFTNQAALVEPGIETTFTRRLQDIIQTQTSLNLVATGGDYIYQGEITRYFIAPMTATANNTASQNRLTIAINVRFTNTKNDEESSEKGYSFYYDYDANTPLQGAVLDTALEIIYEQITQEIINDTLGKW